MNGSIEIRSTSEQGSQEGIDKEAVERINAQATDEQAWIERSKLENIARYNEKEIDTHGKRQADRPSLPRDQQEEQCR